MNYFIILFCSLFLLACNQTRPNETVEITKNQFDQMPKEKQNNGQTLTLYSRDSNQFTIPFYTYIPSAISPYTVDKKAVIFKYGKAKLSLNMLPDTFQSEQQVRHYAKDVLNVISPKVQRAKNGFKTENFEKTQQIIIGQFSNQYYVWLMDIPRGEEQQAHTAFDQIQSQFRWVRFDY